MYFRRAMQKERRKRMMKTKIKMIERCRRKEGRG